MGITETKTLITHIYGKGASYDELENKEGIIYFCTDEEGDYKGVILFNGVKYGSLDEALKSVEELIATKADAMPYETYDVTGFKTEEETYEDEYSTYIEEAWCNILFDGSTSFKAEKGTTFALHLPSTLATIPVAEIISSTPYDLAVNDIPVLTTTRIGDGKRAVNTFKNPYYGINVYELSNYGPFWQDSAYQGDGYTMFLTSLGDCYLWTNPPYTAIAQTKTEELVATKQDKMPYVTHEVWGFGIVDDIGVVSLLFNPYLGEFDPAVGDTFALYLPSTLDPGNYLDNGYTLCLEYKGAILTTSKWGSGEAFTKLYEPDGQETYNFYPILDKDFRDKNIWRSGAEGGDGYTMFLTCLGDTCLWLNPPPYVDKSDIGNKTYYGTWDPNDTKSYTFINLKLINNTPTTFIKPLINGEYATINPNVGDQLYLRLTDSPPTSSLEDGCVVITCDSTDSDYLAYTGYYGHPLTLANSFGSVILVGTWYTHKVGDVAYPWVLHLVYVGYYWLLINDQNCYYVDSDGNSGTIASYSLTPTEEIFTEDNDSTIE